MKKLALKYSIMLIYLSLIALPWSCSEATLKVLDHCCFPEENTVNSARSDLTTQTTDENNKDTQVDSLNMDVLAKNDTLILKILTCIIGPGTGQTLFNNIKAVKDARTAFTTSANNYLNAVDILRSEYVSTHDLNVSLNSSIKVYNICIHAKNSCHEIDCPFEEADVEFYTAQENNINDLINKCDDLINELTSKKNTIQNNKNSSEQQWNNECSRTPFVERCDEPKLAINAMSDVIKDIDTKITDINKDIDNYKTRLTRTMDNKRNALSALVTCINNL